MGPRQCIQTCFLDLEGYEEQLQTTLVRSCLRTRSHHECEDSEGRWDGTRAGRGRCCGTDSNLVLGSVVPSDAGILRSPPGCAVLGVRKPLVCCTQPQSWRLVASSKWLAVRKVPSCDTLARKFHCIRFMLDVSFSTPRIACVQWSSCVSLVDCTTQRTVVFSNVHGLFPSQGRAHRYPIDVLHSLVHDIPVPPVSTDRVSPQGPG